MPVDIHGHRDVGMTELGLNELGVRPLFDHEGSGGVP
jgi:hypothetical protein